MKRDAGYQRNALPNRRHSGLRPVILLHDIVKVLDLTQFDTHIMFSVVTFYSGGVGAAFINGDLLRHATLVDGLAQKARSRFAVALGSQEGSVAKFVFDECGIL